MRQSSNRPANAALDLTTRKLESLTDIERQLHVRNRQGKLQRRYAALMNDKPATFEDGSGAVAVTR